jgi:hypothetical protein
MHHSQSKSLFCRLLLRSAAQAFRCLERECVLEEPSLILLFGREVKREASLRSLKTTMDIPVTNGLVPPLVNIDVRLLKHLVGGLGPTGLLSPATLLGTRWPSAVTNRATYDGVQHHRSEQKPFLSSHQCLHISTSYSKFAITFRPLLTSRVLQSCPRRTLTCREETNPDFKCAPRVGDWPLLSEQYFQ